MKTVIEGKLYRGPEPSTMLDLTGAGIKTIVNLQADGAECWREYSLAQEMGIRFLSFPWHPWLPPSTRTLDAVLDVIRQPKFAPIYVNCAKGVDRTGVAIAAERVLLEGWHIDDAIAEMYHEGFHLWAYWWWVPFLRRYVGSSERSARLRELGYR